MTATEAATAQVETTEEPRVRTAPDTRKRTKPKRQPPYAVVLHNDDLNGMDHVIGVLRKVFHYGRLHAQELMLKAHTSGRVIVWTGTLEVAELKADQIRSCGPDPEMKQHGALALSVTVEPLPQ